MFARTERLLLRPGWIEDAPALAAAIAHEEIAMKLARLPWPYGLADAKDWLSRETPEADTNFVILLRTDGAPLLVGGIGLSPTAEGTEIGYWVAPEHRGKGIATEAGHAVVEMAAGSLQLSHLVSGHYLDNPQSGRVLTKLGFEPTGVIEDRHSVARGHAAPCKLYRRELMPVMMAA